MSGSGSLPTADPVHMAHVLVARFLSQLGYTRTLASFRQDAVQAGATLDLTPLAQSSDRADAGEVVHAGSLEDFASLNLSSIVELAMSRSRALHARAQRRSARHPLRELFPGPAQGQTDVPWSITPASVWGHVHGANILSLQPVFLPRYHFDLETATLRTTFTLSIASTAADRRVAFTQIEGLPQKDTVSISVAAQTPIEAEVVDSLEGLHGGAVISAAQPLPLGGHAQVSQTQAWRTNQLAGRLLATGGMDGRVTFTDMLQSPRTSSETRTVQTLADHQKFVVRVAFTPDGLFFASAGYDKQIHIYTLAEEVRDTPFDPNAFPVPQVGSNILSDTPTDDAEEPETMARVRYTKIRTIHTGTSNPETILFIPAQADFKDEDEEASDSEEEDDLAEEANLGQSAQRGEPELYMGRGTVGGERVFGRRRRAWLVYTVRGDSDVHYIALPQTQALSEGLASVRLDSIPPTRSSGRPGRQVRDFEHIAYNTNAHRLDRHSSYSILETSLHPSGAYLTLQTGPAESSALGLLGSEGAGGHSSRLILLPLHSDGSARVADLWTGATVSSLGVVRHAWTPSGTAVVVASEDGWLRCLDLQGKIRASIPVHGSASATFATRATTRQADHLADARQIVMSEASTEARERSAALMRQSLAWSRGALGGVSSNGGSSPQGASTSGGNTAIRGLAVLNDQCILSAGFDRTLRISFLNTSPSDSLASR